MLVYADNNNRAYGFDCETLEQATGMDTSGADGFEDIEALVTNCNGNTDNIFDFKEDDLKVLRKLKYVCDNKWILHS